MCGEEGQRRGRTGVEDDFLETRNMIRDPLQSTESRAVDSAPNRPTRLGRRISFARPGRGFAALATVVVLFYGVAGYLVARICSGTTLAGAG
jgi:hypothetical protein